MVQPPLATAAMEKEAEAPVITTFHLLHHLQEINIAHRPALLLQQECLQQQW